MPRMFRNESKVLKIQFEKKLKSNKIEKLISFVPNRYF